MGVSTQQSGLVWFELPTSTKGDRAWTFLLACPDVEHEGKKKEWVGLESCQQTLKMESDSLVYLPC